MPPDVEFHLDRYRAMADKRQLFMQDWQDISALCLPDAENILHFSLPGTLLHQRFDATGMEAGDVFASSLQGGLTNPAMEWDRMSFRNKELNKQPGVADWLKEVTTRDMAALASSNFYVCSHTYYLHYGHFGTACMYMEEREDFAGEQYYPGYSFRTVYPPRYCIEENAQGRVDTLYREFALTPRQMGQVFDEAVLPNEVRQQWKQPSTTDQPRVILHCTYPRNDVFGRDGYRQGNRFMPYASEYIDVSAKKRLRERGYEEFPYFVARYKKQNDETPWGVGPGHAALPDMRSLDRMKEMSLEGAALLLQPPLEVLQSGIVGQLSQISLQSLAVNVVTRQQSITPIRLMDGTSKQLIEMDMQRLESAIKRCYSADQLDMLLRPPEQSMTATEFVQRLRVLERLLGPAFFRLQWEFLDPCADRRFGILSRAGVLPQPPMAVIEAAMQNQGQLDVEYIGPLARAQRTGDVEAIQQWYAVGLQIAEATQKPQVLRVMNEEKALRHSGEVLGVPPHLLRTPQEVQAMEQADAEQQAAMLEAAQMEQRASAIGKVAPMVKALQPQGAAA